jgi:hypothetical protein
MNFTVPDLRQRPEFFDDVADRIWSAWWKPRGFPPPIAENFGPRGVTVYVRNRP